MVQLKVVRAVVAVICAGGIAGMIIGSLADNNNGAVMTAGIIAGIAAVALMSFSLAARSATPVVRESTASALEDQVAALVDDGVDEARLREVVRLAIRLGRGQ
jgi:hypothetical protein